MTDNLSCYPYVHNTHKDPDNNGDAPNAQYYISDRELGLVDNPDTSSLRATIASGIAGLERVRAGACPTNDLQVKVPGFYGAGRNDFETAPAGTTYKLHTLISLISYYLTVLLDASLSFYFVSSNKMK